MVRWRRRVGHYTQRLHSNESSLISVSRSACACQEQSLRPGITPGARRWRGASRGRLQRVGVRLRRSSTRTASRRRPPGGSCTSSPASMHILPSDHIPRQPAEQVTCQAPGAAPQRRRNGADSHRRQLRSSVQRGTKHQQRARLLSNCCLNRVAARLRHIAGQRGAPKRPERSSTPGWCQQPAGGEGIIRLRWQSRMCSVVPSITAAWACNLRASCSLKP